LLLRRVRRGPTQKLGGARLDKYVAVSVTPPLVSFDILD
jgi:hypothetical protein